MSTAQTLIDKAANLCGSRYKLWQLTGISQSTLSEMAAGNRPMPPAVAAEIAVVAGEDPREAALAAIVAKEKRPEKRAHLMEIFGLKGGINGAL